MAKFSKCKFFAIFLTLGFFFGCANMRSPSGGPKDTVSPKVVKETPGNLTRNFSGRNIKIVLDKFVTLKDESSEISISPVLDKMPTFKAFKTVLDVKFVQALEKNTTYTINFGNAIVDVNEGNVLKNYTYVFSTGSYIDSLSIRGNVKGALNDKAVTDAIVFILPVSQDSLFGKKGPSIFATTDSAGNFALNNLRGDTYRIYAMKKPKGSGDRIFNANTDAIAFLKDSLVLDSNKTNVQLVLFKGTPPKFNVLSDRIDPDGKIVLVFNKGIADLAIIDPVILDKDKTVEFSIKRDSASIWLSQLTFDSLKVQMNGKNQSRDTLTIYRNKKDTYERAVLINDNTSKDYLKRHEDLVLTLSSPTSQVDTAKISLLQDSIPVKSFQVIKDSLSMRKFAFKYAWKPNKTYSLRFADSTFTDIFGTKSKSYSRQFKLDSADDYGNIDITVAVPDTSKSYLVQWLNEKKEVIRTDAISQNTVLKYLSYPAGKYGLSVVYDANKNGEWDTGDVSAKLQPERIWHYDKVIKIRPNWDLEERVTIPAE